MWAWRFFEKILLLTDVSEEALEIVNQELKIEFRGKTSALLEREAIDKELGEEA